MQKSGMHAQELREVSSTIGAGKSDKVEGTFGYLKQNVVRQASLEYGLRIHGKRWWEGKGKRRGPGCEMRLVLAPRVPRPLVSRTSLRDTATPRYDPASVYDSGRRPANADYDRPPARVCELTACHNEGTQLTRVRVPDYNTVCKEKQTRPLQPGPPTSYMDRVPTCPTLTTTKRRLASQMTGRERRYEPDDALNLREDQATG
jgi:hypothetical protein